MATHSLFLLPGDGIGTEIMVEVEKLIAWTNAEGLTDFSTDSGLAGGAAYDKHGVAITDEDVAKAKAADAVIFGAVGGPKWDNVPYEHRPEAALLRLRNRHPAFNGRCELTSSSDHQLALAWSDGAAFARLEVDLDAP